MFIERDYNWHIETIGKIDYHKLTINNYRFYVFKENKNVIASFSKNEGTFKFFVGNKIVNYLDNQFDHGWFSIEEGKLVCERYYENGGSFVP